MVVLFGLTTGCSIARLGFGDDNAREPVAVVHEESQLREQVELISEMPWKRKESGSRFGRMAGVLINGAKSAGAALDVFGFGGDKGDPESDIAVYYRRKLEGRNHIQDAVNDVTEDTKKKNKQASNLRARAEQVAETRRNELETLSDEDEKVEVDSPSQMVFERIEEDRRLLLRASKDLGQQANVFKFISGELEKEADNPDLTELNREIEKMFDSVRQLEEVADRLKDMTTPQSADG